MSQNEYKFESNAPVGYTTLGHGMALGFAMVFPTIVTLIYFQWLAGNASSFQQGAFGVGKVAQFLFPIVWVLLADRIFWSNQKNSFPFLRMANGTEADRGGLNVGAGGKGNVRLGVGIGFGVFVIALMIAFYAFLISGGDVETALIANVKQKVASFGIDSPLKFLGLGLFYALCHSFLEEYYWRWFVFGYLKKFVSFWPACILSSVGFMAHHVVLLAFFFGWDSPLTYIISGSIFVGGVVWVGLFSVTKSLSAPWASHLLVDAGIFGLGYWMVRDTFV